MTQKDRFWIKEGEIRTNQSNFLNQADFIADALFKQMEEKNIDNATCGAATSILMCRIANKMGIPHEVFTNILGATLRMYRLDPEFNEEANNE